MKWRWLVYYVSFIVIYLSCERVLKNGRVTSHYDIWLLFICFLYCGKGGIPVNKSVKNAKISFSICPYCTLLFSRKENFKFFEVALSAVLYNSTVGCIMNVWGYLHWNTANTTLNLYLIFENVQQSTQTTCKVCSNLTKCSITIDFCIASVFFINLEHLSHPTLVLLFMLWKDKCWLKAQRELFVKIIQWW